MYKFFKDNNQVFTLEQWISANLPNLPNVDQLTELWEKLPTVSIPYDSEADTLKHIRRVQQLLGMSARELLQRGEVHDNSKLGPVEKPYFDEYTPKLAGCTYGSDEYKGFLTALQPALQHHYQNNTHHPEHYPSGLNDMDLFDIIEMLMDWKAASERHNDGNIYRSIEHSKKRFEMSSQLARIFENTARKMGW